MCVPACVLLLLLGAVPAMTSTRNPVVLYNTSGIIVAPEDPSGDSAYLPNARYLWVLDMKRSNVNIEVTVEYVDLGLPYNYLHDEANGFNFTAGDFILIGAGSDIMQGDDLMFFGATMTPRKVIVRSGVGHVFFYSTETKTNSSGFTISYTVAEMATTLPPNTTPTPTPPSFSSAVVSINGIPVDHWVEYNTNFRIAISKMASAYAHEDLNMTTVDVPESDVIINDASRCHPTFCQEDRCVAYDFSVATLLNGEAIFDKGDLENMLADPSANEYIAEVYGKGGEICDDDPNISIVLYVVIPIAVVLFGVIITVAAYKLSDRYTVSHAQDKYEQAQRDRMEDQRRRSSGDISILGVGGRSLASQGSRSSRRFTMPFPKPARDDVLEEADEEGEDEVDTTGFVYYDPDQGIADPAQFGLGGVVSEFTRQGQGSHQYTNQAFVMDEDIAVAIQRSSFADDSDSDSDSGGALSFRPKRREMTSKNQFEVPADVHSPDVEGETAL